ncbi:MAG: type II toxin-antitoxin system HicB family antitoxin [Bacteroidales bacterium]|nr:type II toxin-antitoxin system HicB family antitoxin [Bacteroidales bacterium]
MKRKLTGIIECSENNYCAYVKELDGVAATGSTITGIKERLAEAIEDLIETCEEGGYEIPEALQDGYTIEFKMDVKSLLSVYYGIFTKSALERLTGINQKQLWHYANGLSKPRKAQREKIESALHRLGSELLAIHL